MPEIGIGLIGGGYMGKAHAVAMSSVGAVFNTRLRPRLEVIAAGSLVSAETYRAAYGFNRARRIGKTLCKMALWMRSLSPRPNRRTERLQKRRSRLVNLCSAKNHLGLLSTMRGLCRRRRRHPAW